jgi:hypothetical protein
VARTRIPLVFLAVLALLTVGFAVLGLAMAPNGASLDVQNATAATFGSPPGATSFTMDLMVTVSAGAGTGSISQTRRIVYVPPAHLAVYRAGPHGAEMGTLDRAAITATLTGYVAIVAGGTDWVRHASDFTRTEALSTFVNRVKPQSTTPSTSARGTVDETAVVSHNLLVNLTVRIVVDRQTLADGKTTVGGQESETFRLLTINGSSAPAAPT